MGSEKLALHKSVNFIIIIHRHSCSCWLVINWLLIVLFTGHSIVVDAVAIQTGSLLAHGAVQDKVITFLKDECKLAIRRGTPLDVRLLLEEVFKLELHKLLVKTRL